MRKKYSAKKNFPAWIIFVLAGILFAANLVAQQDEPQIQGRYLFVFSTSAEMKNRVNATETEINQLLSLSMNGALHAGDSIGIWTFDKNVHVGEFPLITWQPENAEETAKAINKFIDRQRYSGTNNFNALLPVLERVIQSSPRLTMLIFCDGGAEINGTPYDDGINPVFKQRFLEQKRIRQPFIIVLRTQFGKYVGSSVNFPPGMVNLPTFPPIPKPQPPAPPPQPVVTNAPPPAPALPLVIIGTHVETNWEAYHFAMTNEPEKSEPPEKNTSNSPAQSSIASVNAPKNSSANAETNPPPPATNSQTSYPATNNIASANNQNFDGKGTMALAAGFLIGAIALAALFFLRSRRGSHGSLISRSMKK